LPEGGWPNWVLGNHDRPRIASRVGLAQARVAAMLLLTLRGTPTIYYGEEIGMRQAEIAPHQVRDPFELNVPGRGLGRDGCRTPMQWDGSTFGGFSDVEPWLPLGADHRSNHVENQRREQGSLHDLYRRLIALRRRETALTTGAYRPIAARGDVLVYGRGDRILVVLNLGDQPMHMDLGAEAPHGIIVLSTELDREGETMDKELALRGNEGLIVALQDDTIA
jgi:alpha-glucosidase